MGFVGKVGPRTKDEVLTLEIFWRFWVGHTEILHQYSPKNAQDQNGQQIQETKNTHIKITELDTIVWALEENTIQISWWEHLSRDSHREVNPPGRCVAPGIEHTPHLRCRCKGNSFVGSVNRLFTMSFFLINVSKTKKQRVYQFLELPAIKRYIARSIYLAASRRRLDFARDVGSKGENNSIR